MRISALIALIFLSFGQLVLAQKAPASGKAKTKDDASHKIKIRVKGISDTTVYLANYYGQKLFYNDTAKADKNGYFEFKGKPFEEGGKYAVVVPGPKFFELLVDDKNIHLETDASDFVGTMKVIESENNRIFFDYIKFINDKRMQRSPLDTALSKGGLSAKEEADIKKKIEALNESVSHRQREIVASHSNELIGKLIRMTIEPDVPETPEGIEDPNWRYNYFIEHYWDNVDLTDPRLIRDQQMHTRLDRFITQALLQIPDSITKWQDWFLARVGDNYELRKYATHHFTYTAEKSQIMCMDKVFVHMVDKYYKTGNAEWLKEDQLKKIIDAADDKRNVQCGNKAVNIILPDTSGVKWRSLYDVKADYTILAVWESSCGHCKKEMPKLHDLYLKWKGQGVDFFVVGNDFDNDEWKKTIKKNGYSWINVSDNPQINKADSARTLIIKGITTLESLNFRKTYDITSTPRVFVLDKDKTIIAKQLSSEQIDELLTRMKGDAANKPEEQKAVLDEKKGKRK
jgi:thiol-disulfide isomerase/thioredoxin